MPERRCPACNVLLEGNVSSSGHCAGCGHDVTVQAGPVRWVDRGVNLREVARRQRGLLWVILAMVGVYFSTIFIIALERAVARPLIPFIHFGFGLSFLIIIILVVVFVVRLQAAQGIHVVWQVLTAIFLFAPCINLFVLLAVNARATRTLRDVGLRVGFMGVRDEDVIRHISSDQCRQCGYILIGNTSGICPECGTPTDVNIPVGRPLPQG